MSFDVVPSGHLTSRSVNREISQLRFSQQLNAFFGRIWSLICSTANYSAKLLKTVALTKRRANEIAPSVQYLSDSNRLIKSLKGRVSSISISPTTHTTPVNVSLLSSPTKSVPSTNPQSEPNLPPHIAPESPQKTCSSLHSSSSQPAISVSSPNLTSIAYSPNFEYSVDFFDRYFEQCGFESNFKTILQTAKIYKDNKSISTPFNELSGEYTINIASSISIKATLAEGMFKTFYFLDKKGAILEGYYENGELILTSIITPDRLTKFEGRFINGKVTDSQGKIFYNTNSPHNTDSLQDFNACYEGPIVDQLPHGKGIYKQEGESEERVYFKGNFTSAEYDSTKKSYTVLKQETISEIRELSFEQQQVLGYQSTILSYDEECEDWTETDISINYEGSLQTYFKHGQGTLCSTYFHEREGKKIKIIHQYVGEFEFDFFKAESGEYTVIINDISSDTEIQGTVRFTSHGEKFKNIILNTQEYVYEFDLIHSEHTIEDAMFLTGYGTRNDGKKGKFINGFHIDEYQLAEDDEDENGPLSIPQFRTDSQKLMSEVDVDGDYTDEDNEDETSSINSDATSGDYTSEEDLSSSEEVTDDNLFENEK
ncbi:hypothetical protein [Candidatus Protochlamydia amoebophila]|uniref:MORN repeat-containing protein n=1 Tax=Protochlamydia amoebophila (strain UWE25) TaxID=264201 RepID=Q6MAF9_PARUW|nr:hypothetical protein [Candidatus Protochlamydia amoebophila]CAF24440.1 unnamed protein product [Candidatus Protochlamydia amoebophila UWE25]